MFDLFGVGKLTEGIKETRDMKYILREKVFNQVESSNEFLFKILNKKNSKEYWDWRLDFDMRKYRIGKYGSN